MSGVPPAPRTTECTSRSFPQSTAWSRGIDRWAPNVCFGNASSEHWRPGAAVRLPEGSPTPGWLNPSVVQRNYSLVLLDHATGRRVNMRTTPQYQMRSGPDGAERRFSIEMTPRGEAALVVHSLAAQPARGGGAEVTFVVSQACYLDATVTSIAGHPVAQACRGKAVSAGQQTLLWDGRSAGGLRVPNGRYLVRVTGRAEDGTQATALGAIEIRR